jgi:hypothetical protein
MTPPVQYQVWRHTRSRELWAVRLEYDELTGACGPLPDCPRRTEELADLLYEDHPDDLEWIVRACEHFVSVARWPASPDARPFP